MVSCLGLVLRRRRKVESRIERASEPYSRSGALPPQQIECRIEVPIIPDAWAGLEGAEEGEDEHEQEGK
jgi:hypothetical protein